MITAGAGGFVLRSPGCQPLRRASYRANSRSGSGDQVLNGAAATLASGRTPTSRSSSSTGAHVNASLAAGRGAKAASAVRERGIRRHLAAPDRTRALGLFVRLGRRRHEQPLLLPAAVPSALEERNLFAEGERIAPGAMSASKGRQYAAIFRASGTGLPVSSAARSLDADVIAAAAVSWPAIRGERHQALCLPATHLTYTCVR